MHIQWKKSYKFQNAKPQQQQRRKKIEGKITKIPNRRAKLKQILMINNIKYLHETSTKKTKWETVSHTIK